MSRNHLPLLEARATETTRCTFCPKLCRPACPVGSAEGRETSTPWGIMRALGALADPSSPVPPADLAETAWSCTGCGGCEGLCLLHNPVRDTLWDARREAHDAELLPATVKAFREGFEARLARLQRPAALDEVGVGDGSVVFLPGCTMVAREPELLRQGAAAVARLTGGARTLTGVCCGAPLLDAGDERGFRAAAARLTEALGDAEHLVLGDAGCAYALRSHYAKRGLFAPSWRRVEHVSELASRSLDAIPRVHDERAVFVHDACRLGRGLGVYDAPRAALHAMLGAPPRELPVHREHAQCSGGGGLLPRTNREASRAVAGELAALVHEAAEGAPAVVVTSCPESRAQLRVQGVESEDLLAWLARALGV